MCEPVRLQRGWNEMKHKNCFAQGGARSNCFTLSSVQTHPVCLFTVLCLWAEPRSLNSFPSQTMSPNLPRPHTHHLSFPIFLSPSSTALPLECCRGWQRQDKQEDQGYSEGKKSETDRGTDARSTLHVTSNYLQHTKQFPHTYCSHICCPDTCKHCTVLCCSRLNSGKTNSSGCVPRRLWFSLNSIL